MPQPPWLPSHTYTYIYIYCTHKNSIRYEYVLIFPLHYRHFLTALQSPQWRGTVTGSPTLMASGGYDSNGKTGTERPPTEVLFSPLVTKAWHEGLTVMDQKKFGGYFWSFKNWWVRFEAWDGGFSFGCSLLYCPHNTSEKSSASHYHNTVATPCWEKHMC